MRSLLIFLLLSVVVNAALARNLVKRSNCCCDDYRECSSSCSTPCNRPRNCNNNNNWSPCNNDRVEEESDTVPVLIPFPSASNISQPSPIVNNTNISNNTVELTIQNTIDNINNISIPITVNSTNENTVVIHFQRVADEIPDEEVAPTVAPSTVDCCLVVTPRACDRNGRNCQGGRKQWVCSAVCKGATDIEPVPESEPEPEVPAQLTVRNENITSVPVRTTVYSVPYNYPIIYQPAPQPAPQPTYFLPWPSVQRNFTARPTQQVLQVPIQPIYTQQRPVYNIPRQPVVQPVYLPQPAIQRVQQPFQIVQQPFQTIQQPIQTIQQVPLPRYGLVNQYSQDNYVVSSYGAPCPYANQGPSRSPCGSSVVQY